MVGGPPLPPMLWRPLLHPMSPRPSAGSLCFSPQLLGWPQRVGQPTLFSPSRADSRASHPGAHSSWLLASLPPMGSSSCHWAQSLLSSSILVTSALRPSLRGGYRQTLSGPVIPPSSWP